MSWNKSATESHSANNVSVRLDFRNASYSHLPFENVRRKEFPGSSSAHVTTHKSVEFINKARVFWSENPQINYITNKKSNRITSAPPILRSSSDNSYNFYLIDKQQLSEQRAKSADKKFKDPSLFSSDGVIMWTNNSKKKNQYPESYVKMIEIVKKIRDKEKPNLQEKICLTTVKQTSVNHVKDRLCVQTFTTNSPTHSPTSHYQSCNTSPSPLVCNDSIGKSKSKTNGTVEDEKVSLNNYSLNSQFDDKSSLIKNIKSPSPISPRFRKDYRMRTERPQNIGNLLTEKEAKKPSKYFPLNDNLSSKERMKIKKKVNEEGVENTKHFNEHKGKVKKKRN